MCLTRNQHRVTKTIADTKAKKMALESVISHTKRQISLPSMKIETEIR